jgi:hypothetical protein
MYIFLLLALLTAPLFGQEVVINKYFNNGNAQTGEGDIVELLVVSDRVNLRGYMVRDFATTTTTNTLIADSVSAGSGWFTFSQNIQWERVRAGTRIQLRVGDNRFLTFADTLITVGLQNSLYFGSGGNFNIAARDMVMLKRPNAPFGGTTGSVHAFSTGITIAELVGISPLLRTSDVTGTERPVALPDNRAGNLSDYSGNLAGTVAPVDFGIANNAANQRFIDSLRRTRTTSVRSSPPQSLVVSPLPASTECVAFFDLKIATPIVISVTDMKGASKELHRASLEAGEQSIRLSMSGLSAGAYFLTVRTNVGEWQERVLVVR